MSIYRTMAGGLFTVAALLLPTGATTAAQSRPDPDRTPCLSSDTACRLTRLENRVDYLIDLMERQDRLGRRGQDRTLDIPVDQACGIAADGCSTLATRLCTEAGFAHGIPTRTTRDVFDVTLTRITCMD
jgi:hypothetical protein